MREKEFNLLEEPWIRVRSPDCAVREVSLTDALLHAHEVTDLAGELPAQDAAVLRLLLAVLHTVFSRVDEQVIPAPFQSEEDAVARWGMLWRMGRFPEEPLRRYLETWREILALSSGSPVLAGAAGKDRDGVHGGEAQWRAFRERQ